MSGPEPPKRQLTNDEIERIMAQGKGISAMAGHNLDDPEFDADARAVLRGGMTFDDVVARVIDRVRRGDL